MKSTAQLKKLLDKVFSEYIRLRDSDSDGYGRCCTCGKRIHWKEGDCGHFISRTWLATRWDERNAHLQCKGCNGYRNGMPDEYAVFLIEKYEDDILHQLLTEKRKTLKMSRSDYEIKIDEYREKVKELK